MIKRYKINETLEVSVEEIVSNGLGLCFVEDLTVFVPLSAKGDRLLVKISQIKGKLAFARIIEILKPSSDRVKPRCVYFGVCGGCDFQHLSYKAQLKAKVGIIRDCLKRIGKIDFREEIPIIASTKEFGYRLRTQFHVEKHSKKIGFFKRRSHKVINIDSCPILDPILDLKLTDLRKNLRWQDLLHRTVSIKAVGFQGKNSIHSPKLIESTEEVSYRLNENNYFFNANTFFQCNQYLVRQLAEKAVERVKGKTAFDLYCGVGLFSLLLANRFREVFGVDTNKTAIEFAKKNAEHARLDNIVFKNERVRDFLTNIQAKKVDFILIDPQRSGVKKGTLDKLAELRANRISYVSCNPSTLARDLRILINLGYEIKKITALDLFPQNHHVETVVHLSSEI